MGPKGSKKPAAITSISAETSSSNMQSINNNEPQPIVKSKRGRKSKQELMAALQMTDQVSLTIKDNSNSKNIINDNTSQNNSDVKAIEPQVIKKRGRKPKGGKIIQPTISIDSYKEEKPNIIMHLKCSLKDLLSFNNGNSCVGTYDFTNHDLGFDLYGTSNITISNYNNNNNNGTTAISSLEQSCLLNNCGNLSDAEDAEDDDIINKDKTKEIWRKLKQLEHNLHINNINNKKSCCFWDTCEFDGPAIYAPKYRRNGIIYVEGCFCCPQCAAAYIINKPNIDNSTRFECLYLLNYLYGSIFEYTKNINPAPDPRYMLNKFLGNLSIQQYRSILGNERLFLIVDKPLTRILPELHEYNDEFILNNKIIPSNNYQLKARLQKKKQDKNSILNEKFGINYGEMAE